MAVTIKLDPLRELAAAGGVKGATILGQKGGYAVLARIGMQERPLGTRQGSVRMFGSLDSAVRTLRDLGLAQFQVDVSNYEEGRLRAARPDVRKRAAEAREAVDHARWVTDQVAPVYERVTRGEATLHSHESVWNRVQAHARQRLEERDAAAPPPALPARPGKD